MNDRMGSRRGYVCGSCKCLTPMICLIDPQPHQRASQPFRPLLSNSDEGELISEANPPTYTDAPASRLSTIRSRDVRTHGKDGWSQWGEGAHGYLHVCTRDQDKGRTAAAAVAGRQRHWLDARRLSRGKRGWKRAGSTKTLKKGKRD